MKDSKWKYIFASEVGTSHKKVCLPCQDNSDCSIFYPKNHAPILVAVVSDGAGSAKKAEVGSKLACTLFISEMRALFEEQGGSIDDITLEFIKEWVKHFQHEVSCGAENEGIQPRDFACTFLVAIIAESSAVFAQIGDGAIVVQSSESPMDYCWVFWPQQGEYVNITNFITDKNVYDKIQYNFVKHSVREVAIFTDGIQNLALHYQTQTAHSPFFRSMFNWLSKEPIGYSKELATALAVFLNSEKVNELTDDDKTLILASR